MSGILFCGAMERLLSYVTSLQEGCRLRLLVLLLTAGWERGFFGHDIYSIENVNGIEYDAILVASLDGRASETINKAGVNPERVYYL